MLVDSEQIHTIKIQNMPEDILKDTYIDSWRTHLYEFQIWDLSVYFEKICPIKWQNMAEEILNAILMHVSDIRSVNGFWTNSYIKKIKFCRTILKDIYIANWWTHSLIISRVHWEKFQICGILVDSEQIHKIKIQNVA